jgi:lipopolysaccharide export system protein LptC
MVIQIIRDAWDRFLLYVPLTVMGVLALGTYWLVHTTVVVHDPVAMRSPTHEPDYFIRGFSVRTFDAAGRLRTEVLGQEARHYPDTGMLEVDSIHVRSFDMRGHLTTATAERGLTDEGTTEVQLLGKASVVREAFSDEQAVPAPRIEYRGEFLHAFIKSERIKSHRPVELLRGKDRFTADSLDFDNVDRVLQLTGRVRGTLFPGNR